MPPSIGGPEVDNVVIAAFAALVWHTPTLRQQISRYGIGTDCTLTRDTLPVKFLQMFQRLSLRQNRASDVCCVFAVSADCEVTVSEDLQRAYITAESLRSALVCTVCMHCVLLTNLLI